MLQAGPPKDKMRRVKLFVSLISFIGSVLLFRAYYLVSFAAGYSISKADNNQRLFLAGGLLCAMVFLVLSVSMLRGAKNH
jgi:uncharacterized membrane protein YdcZ (DUF606 family)